MGGRVPWLPGLRVPDAYAQDGGRGPGGMEQRVAGLKGI